MEIKLKQFIEDFGPECVVVSSGEEESCAAIFGHWIYVRKCEQEKFAGSDLWMPAKSKDTCSWHEVVAKGTRAGNRRTESKAEMQFRRHNHKWPLDGVERGDVVLAPKHNQWGCAHSAFSDDEFFMDEEVLIAKATKREGKSGMNITPLGDRILVDVDWVSGEETMKDGIVIPSSSREKPREGVVVALGTGKLNDDGSPAPFCVKVGDRVILPRHGCVEIVLEDKTHYIIREDELLGISS